MKKRKNVQVYRDPIYGYITVEYDLITKLINTSEFQRLRRIRQLAGVSMIYPGAEHSRFSHSLGVYHLANEFIKNSELKEILSEREQLLFLVSALLHDIGHGPYSHAFEDVFKTNHENIGAKIILKQTNVNKHLKEIDEGFANDVASIILKNSNYKIIENLISSQLDIDRLDYLLRDTYYTGAFYGHVDVLHIMRNMRIKDGLVTFKENAISAIENFLISRHHMYWQVYFHPGTRAYEVILEKIYKRIKKLSKKETENLTYIRQIIANPEDLRVYLRIDDHYINGLVSSFLDSEDLILKTLANDFINRNIWEHTEAGSVKERDVTNSLTTEEQKYYTAKTTAYSETYKNDIEDFANNIYILKNNGQINTLATESTIIKSLVNSGAKKDERFFYRKI